MKQIEAASCFEVIGGVDDAIRGSLQGDDKRYMVVGGLLSKALIDEKTVIQPGEIIAGPDSDLPIFRPEDNTRRDIDVLVPRLLSHEEGMAVRDAVSEAVHNELVVSVFGLDPHQAELSPRDRMRLRLTEFLSRRTIDANGIYRLELFPLEQEIPASVFEEHRLITPQGHAISVMNPAVHVLNYATRSISGLRPKDTKKVNNMARRVFADRDLADRVMNRDYLPLLTFAAAIDAIRDGRFEPGSPHVRADATAADIRSAMYKGRPLRWAESQEWIVNFARQGPMQKMLNFAIRAA